MRRTFHRSTNTIARVSIFGFLFFLAGLAWVMITVGRSSYVTEAGIARRQPVPFSHKHHVADDGIDCRYCHTTVENSSFAGMPSTQICMNCHSQIWADSPMLEPVRASYRTGEPLHWTRVHMQWQTPANQDEMGRELVRSYKIKDARSLMSCSTCHR
ncbi:MAG: hypothetical protein DMF68_22150 [Acidobacteria bacterium]|nr:MAG: hypothetical protein DMF68_22150 [Acidobacteriota bacterium]